MNPTELSALLSNWLERQTRTHSWDANNVLQRLDLHPESEDRLDEIGATNPSLYWDLLLQALHTDQSDEVMQALSYRVQHLLEADRSGLVLSKAEAQANDDPVFKELLAWLLPLPSDTGNELWSRIRRVAGKVPW